MLQRFAFIFVLLLFVPDAYIYWGYIKGKLKGKSRESRQSSIFNVQCSMSRLLWWLPSILLVIGFIAARYIGTDNPMSERQGIIAWLGMLILWLGVPKLIFMLVSLIGKLIHLIIKPVSEKPFNWAGIILALCFFGIAFYGSIFGVAHFQINEVDVHSSRLPKAFDGYRIVQISDIHSGSFSQRPGILKEMVKLVNEQKADLIVFTGDLVNQRADEIDQFTDILSQMKAPDGVYSILGNHDYGNYFHWAKPEDEDINQEHLEKQQFNMGWKFLKNQHDVLYRGNDSIAIIGVENEGNPPFPQKADLPKASQGTEGMYRILLSHDPTHWRKEVLPDTDIDLMDEAAAKLRMERDSVPEELDEITRRLAQLEIERSAISREIPTSPTSPTSPTEPTQKLADLDREIAELREQESQFRARWEGERQLVNQIQQDKQQMENLKFEAERAEREGNYGRVAEIRYGKMKELEQHIASVQQQLNSTSEGNKLVREEVTADDIAEVVSRWTGIPVTRMMQSEREKLLHLEAELHKRVIGQDEAIQAVSDAVRRSRAGLQDPKRPIASFIFMGTTGVGKTELAKALAEYLFNDETMMTRIDMSEYQEKHTVSRLIGAPPGYVGYDEGGQLTEAVRRKPYSVVLFDEIEKAHPDVFNILLQVLDDGRLTDNKGRTADFKNTIIIMTSNATRDQLRMVMRPEFLNRIDEIITFQQLTEDQIAQVVRLQLERVKKMLEPQGFQLEVSDHAVRWLAHEGFDPDMGARPVKRAIQHYVLNDLSRKLLADEVNRERPIVIDEFGDGLVFHN